MTARPPGTLIILANIADLATLAPAAERRRRLAANRSDDETMVRFAGDRLSWPPIVAPSAPAGERMTGLRRDSLCFEAAKLSNEWSWF
jgi:hypothetical protein